MLRPAPRSTRTDTLVPVPALFLYSVTAAMLPTVIPFWFPGCPGWKLGPTPAVAWGVSGGTRRCGGSFPPAPTVGARPGSGAGGQDLLGDRSEEHTSALQSLMRISSAVFFLNKQHHIQN